MTKHYSENSVEAMRLLVHHLMKLRDQTQAEIGADWGLDRQQVSKFLTRKLKRENEEKLYRKLARKIAEDHHSAGVRELPYFMLSVVKAVYQDELAVKLCQEDPEQKQHTDIIKDQVALRFKSSYDATDTYETTRKERLPKITGLSLLVRPSNEYKPYNGNTERGVSVSVLNLVPEHIDTGDHHPLFKLHQLSLNDIKIDIEGAVLTQDDRIVLMGRESLVHRNAILSITLNNEDIDAYRNFEDSEDARKGLGGVMLGVSNRRNHFSSYFRIFAIPGGFIDHEKTAGKEQEKRFDDALKKARKLAGVYAVEELEGALKKVGVINCMDSIQTMLKQAATDKVFSAG